MKRFAHGATEAPDPSGTPKLSGAGPGRYCGGAPLNFSFRLNSEVKHRKNFSNLSFSLPVVVEFSDIKTFSIDSRGSLNVYSNNKLRVTL